MKNAIAATELFGVTPDGERRRLTVAVGAPTRGPRGRGWHCKVTIADVLRPTPVAGADSYQALCRAVASVREHLAGLAAEGWSLSLDADGREALDLRHWPGSAEPPA